MRDDDLVFSGIGILTGCGVGIADHLTELDTAVRDLSPEDLSLTKFKPAPLLSDRRLLKTISPIDAIGLVGIEDLRRHTGYDQAQYDPWRVGLYVGSPPAHAIDGALHHDAMEASRDASGRCCVREFGRTSAQTRPTAILSGLPNNTLCYGAMLLNAKGPNSNYNCLEISGHTAVMNAARAFRRGRLDYAVAGGFSGHTFEPNRAMFARLEMTSIIADGAVFLSMERRKQANARSGEAFATYVAGASASDAGGPLSAGDGGMALEDAIQAALAAGGVGSEDVGLVFASGTGTCGLVRGEEEAITRVFGAYALQQRPAVVSLAPVVGNLMEAGGLFEIAVAKAMYTRQQLPAALLMAGDRFANIVDQGKRHVLVLRTSLWGEYSCLLLRID